MVPYSCVNHLNPSTQTLMLGVWYEQMSVWPWSIRCRGVPQALSKYGKPNAKDSYEQNKMNDPRPCT